METHPDSGLVTSSGNQSYFKQHVRDVPDFPNKGVVFRDITPLLRDPGAFNKAINKIIARFSPILVVWTWAGHSSSNGSPAVVVRPEGVPTRWEGGKQDEEV